jgi:Fe-S-cluster containining protein
MPEMHRTPVLLNFPEGRIEAEIDLPVGAVRLVVLAYKMLAISSTVADMATRAAEKMGFQVSCKKGCGVCCRQLVPLSPPEAAMVFEFVESMPEPRRSKAKKGFSVALNRLKETGHIKRLAQLEDPLSTPDDYVALAGEYFLEQIPCPFLVNECCSIHAVRPSMCREYLVSSPAENCRYPLDGQVRRLPVSVRLSEALARTWASLSNRPAMVIPFISALEWTEENRHTRSLSGKAPQLLTLLLGHISEVAAERQQETTRC